MFNLPDSLFVGSFFCVLVLSVAGGDGLAVGGGMGVKDTNVKEGTFVTATPKATCRNIQPCAVFCDGRSSREKFTGDCKVSVTCESFNHNFIITIKTETGTE